MTRGWVNFRFPHWVNFEFPLTIIIHGADLICPDMHETSMMTPEQVRVLNVLLEHSLSDAARTSGNILVLRALQGPVHRGLLRTGGFVRLMLPLPSEDMRRDFATTIFRIPRYAKPTQSISIDEFARLTNGTMLRSIEGLARKRGAENAPIARQDIATIKGKSISDLSAGQIGVITPSRTLDQVVGLEHIKRFIAYQQLLAREGSPSMPSIVLAMGTPGIGKSHMFEAYAHALEWTLLEWRNMRSMWVGQSESRTEAALEIIRQNAPCLVKMDEVDQAIGGRSSTATDGGVDARIFAQILTFTGDAALRGKVQFLMATNRPDLLDAAIIDRAGAKLIFLPPSRQDRIALLEHVAAFQKRTLAPDVDLRSLASHPSLSVASVRNLQEVVFKGGRIADMRAKGTNAVITAEALDRAVRMFNPGNTAELEFLALKCLELVTFYDELPWMDDEGAVLPGTEYPSFLEGVVDPATGRFAPHQLAARLREKEQLRAVRRLSS